MALRSSWWIPAALTAALAACTGSITGGDAAGDPVGGGGGAPGEEGAPAPDEDPPVIEITAPLRGAMVEGVEVEVVGRVVDHASAVAVLTVNGQPAELAADGSFRLLLATPPGITLVETIARDEAGNERADVRAVLAGTMVDQATPVRAGITAHIGTRALAAFTRRVRTVANGTNLTALATALNPLVNTGSGCNSARIYVDSVGRSGISVAAAPVTGGIDADVTVRDLVVRGRVTFRALCISGSTSWTIRATGYDVGGLLRPSVSSGDLRVGIASVTSGFRGFQLSVGSIPGFVTDLIRNQVRDRLASMLRGKITQVVPAQASAFLDEFMVDSWTVSLLGQPATFSIAPTSTSWNASGGSLALDVTSSLGGVTGASYLATPRARPSSTTMTSTGLRVSLADDVVNQLLAGLWAASGFEVALQPAIAEALAALGADVAGAELTLLLPPVVSFDGGDGAARLTIGDLVLEATDRTGATVVKVVLSADLALAAGASESRRMKVVTEDARVRVQALGGDDAFLAELDPDTLDSLARLALDHVAGEADRVLGAIPVPGLPGVSVSSPTVEPVAGYLILGGALTLE